MNLNLTELEAFIQRLGVNISPGQIISLELTHSEVTIKHRTQSEKPSPTAVTTIHDWRNSAGLRAD